MCVWAAEVVLGCATYVPVALDSVPVGASVRALLSPQAGRTLHDSLGLELQALRGTLVERHGSSLLFQVRTATGSPALGGQPLYQRIVVSPPDVLRVDVRHVHPVRTAGLVGAVAALATLVVAEAARHRNPGIPEPPGGGPAERVVPR